MPWRQFFCFCVCSEVGKNKAILWKILSCKLSLHPRLGRLFLIKVLKGFCTCFSVTLEIMWCSMSEMLGVIYLILGNMDM